MQNKRDNHENIQNEYTFASRLKEARKKLHYSGKETAKKTGINYNTYMSYENGVSNRAIMPSAENLIKISNVLGVSIDYLLTGKNKEVVNFKGLHVIQIPQGLGANDIEPIINTLEQAILLNKNVTYHGLNLSNKCRRDALKDISKLKADITLFPLAESDKILIDTLSQTLKAKRHVIDNQDSKALKNALFDTTKDIEYDNSVIMSNTSPTVSKAIAIARKALRGEKPIKEEMLPKDSEYLKQYKKALESGLEIASALFKDSNNQADTVAKHDANNN